MNLVLKAETMDESEDHAKMVALRARLRDREKLKCLESLDEMNECICGEYDQNL